uniref:helix-turn-helix domain-containing protein n=1 Tax=Rhodoferax sp. GW822-FHT02A01 TaxID=3141537 RepID=UPI00406C9373
MALAIADFSDDDGRAYPSVATLARKCRIKPRNANYLLRQLQDSGELSVRMGAGPKGCNLYKINVKGLQSIAGLQSTAGVQPVAGGLQSTARTPCTPLQTNHH